MYGQRSAGQNFKLPLNNDVRSPCYKGGNVDINSVLEMLAEGPKSARAYHTFLTLGLATSQTLFNEEKNRAYLLVINRGPGNLYLTFGQIAQGANLNYPAAIVIPATGNYELKDPVMIDTVFCVADQANTVVTGVQGVWTLT